MIRFNCGNVELIARTEDDLGHGVGFAIRNIKSSTTARRVSDFRIVSAFLNDDEVDKLITYLSKDRKVDGA